MTVKGTEKPKACHYGPLQTFSCRFLQRIVAQWNTVQLLEFRIETECTAWFTGKHRRELETRTFQPGSKWHMLSSTFHPVHCSQSTCAELHQLHPKNWNVIIYRSQHAVYILGCWFTTAWEGMRLCLVQACFLVEDSDSCYGLLRFLFHAWVKHPAVWAGSVMTAAFQVEKSPNEIEQK